MALRTTSKRKKLLAMEYKKTDKIVLEILRDDQRADFGKLMKI